MRASLSAVAVTALLVPLVACGPAEGEDDSGSLEAQESALLAKRDGMTLELKDGTGRSGKVSLRATTNAKVTDAQAFVPDDPIGEMAISRTGYTVKLVANELQPLLEGLPLFISTGLLRDGGARSLVARADLRAGLVRRTGSTKLAPRAWFQAFMVNGEPVVRLRGSAPATVRTVSAKLGGTTIEGTGRGREWVVEVPVKLFAETAAANRTISLAVTDASGTQRAGFGAIVKVARLQLDEGDAYEIWPAAECTAALRSCLADAGADTSSCGDAYTIRRCPRSPVGVTEADARGWMDAALEELSPDFSGDFATIWGEDRAAALEDAVHAKAIASSRSLVGSTHAPEALFDAAKALARPIYEDALAHPMKYLSRTAPRAGELATGRVVALEALLEYLDGQDLTRTEYGRPLDELVRTYRARWVADLANLRNGTGEASELTTQPTQWVLHGRVLSTYLELTVSRTTGKATHVLFEID